MQESIGVSKPRTLGDLFNRKQALETIIGQGLADLQDQINPIIAKANEGLEPYRAELAQVQAEIDGLASELVAQARKDHAKEFGVIKAASGGVVIKATRDKKVTWDQGELRKVFDRIRSAGDDPFTWMGIKFSVAEQTYSKMPGQIQAVFQPARTVEAGPEKIAFEIINIED